MKKIVVCMGLVLLAGSTSFGEVNGVSEARKDKKWGSIEVRPAIVQMTKDGEYIGEGESQSSQNNAMFFLTRSRLQGDIGNVVNCYKPGYCGVVFAFEEPLDLSEKDLDSEDRIDVSQGKIVVKVFHAKSGDIFGVENYEMKLVPSTSFIENTEVQMVFKDEQGALIFTGHVAEGRFYGDVQYSNSVVNWVNRNGAGSPEGFGVFAHLGEFDIHACSVVKCSKE